MTLGPHALWRFRFRVLRDGQCGGELTGGRPHSKLLIPEGWVFRPFPEASRPVSTSGGSLTPFPPT